MDIRMAAAEHYDKGIEALAVADQYDPSSPTESYLRAITHLLAGLLRHEMSRTP